MKAILKVSDGSKTALYNAKAKLDVIRLKLLTILAHPVERDNNPMINDPGKVYVSELESIKDFLYELEGILNKIKFDYSLKIKEE